MIAVWPDPSSLQRVWLARLTLTCFLCDWESGFMTLGWVYPAMVSLPNFQRGKLTSKGWVTRMLIVSRHAPTTSSVTFICLLLSSQRAQHRANLNTLDSGTELGIREVQRLLFLIRSCLGVAAQQQSGYSLVLIPSDCDSRNWGMGEGKKKQRVVELEPSSPCKRLTEN